MATRPVGNHKPILTRTLRRTPSCTTGCDPPERRRRAWRSQPLNRIGSRHPLSRGGMTATAGQAWKIQAETILGRSTSEILPDVDQLANGLPLRHALVIGVPGGVVTPKSGFVTERPAPKTGVAARLIKA